jgi:hypothetical protein
VPHGHTAGKTLFWLKRSEEKKMVVKEKHLVIVFYY